MIKHEIYQLSCDSVLEKKICMGGRVATPVKIYLPLESWLRVWIGCCCHTCQRVQVMQSLGERIKEGGLINEPSALDEENYQGCLQLSDSDIPMWGRGPAASAPGGGRLWGGAPTTLADASWLVSVPWTWVLFSPGCMSNSFKGGGKWWGKALSWSVADSSGVRMLT